MLLKKQQKKNKQLYGKDYVESGLVCCWQNGSPMKTEYLNHKFKDMDYGGVTYLKQI